MTEWVVNVPFPASSGTIVDVAGTGGPVLYQGYNIYAAAAAVVHIREGGASGRLVDTLSVAAGGCASVVYPVPINVNGDLYFEIVTGSAIEGSVRIA